MWKQMKTLAATIPHDLTMVVPYQQGRPIPADLYTGVTQDTLVIAGGKSPQWLKSAQDAVAQLPHGRLVTLPGQTHMIKPTATAPAVVEHLTITGKSPRRWRVPPATSACRGYPRIEGTICRLRQA